MPLSVLKRAAREVCPPVLWRTARRLLAARALATVAPIAAVASAIAPLFYPGSARVVRTTEELDREIERADRAAARGDDAFRQAMTEFRFADLPAPPGDPESPAYHEAVMAHYRLVSGRPRYDPLVNEQTPLDLPGALARPFPYCTQSSVTVGEYLIAVGGLIRALALRPGSRVLEFGVGHGATTLEMARMGCEMTAVDINPLYLELVSARAAQVGVSVNTATADMLTFSAPARFDRVVFFECFHHCPEPVRLVRRLADLVADGGMVCFAGEPIADDFPCPWGLRLDGMSALSIRKWGWMELGFRTDYFLGLLEREGWTAERRPSLDVPWQNVILARRR
jgi:SAM-dependent methyltransferase